MTRLGNLGEWTGGGTPSKNRSEYWENGMIPWVSPKDMKQPLIASTEDAITPIALDESSAKLVPSGSVLVVTRSGILEHSLPIARTQVDVAINQDLKALTPHAGVDSAYVAWALRRYAEEILRECTKTGTTVASIVTKRLQEFQIPLPDLMQQQRIVRELDAHSTLLDAAQVNLRRVRANLNRYRTSILTAACEGRLTPNEAELASREGRDYEPGDVLLQRLLAERRARAEARHRKRMKAKGKPPQDDRWKEKYKDPEGPDMSGLPGLPEGWVWARMDQIAEVIGGLTKNRGRKKLDRRIPYLRVANIYANELILDEVKTIGVKDGELSRVLLERDDLLIVEGNGSLDQIGRVALWDGSIDPCGHQNHLIKARLVHTEMAKFVLYWLLSEGGRNQITALASSTSGLYTLSLSKISALPIPLPPIAEQHRIVSEIESRLSLADAVRVQVKTEIARAERLRQSILRTAFRGGFTPSFSEPAKLERETTPVSVAPVQSARA